MTNVEEHLFWINAREVFRERLSLTDDKADDDVIDERIRGDVSMKGANLWILMFAILVASIGLNVNSTAVVIGAMLISPLMGPIMGIGYGAGINDFTLIRSAFKNLAIATLIALLTINSVFIALASFLIVRIFHVVEKLKERIRLLSNNREFYTAIPRELETLFPKVNNVILSQSYDPAAVDYNRNVNRLILNVDAKKRLSANECQKIEAWLKMRTKSDNVKLIVQ